MQDCEYSSRLCDCIPLLYQQFSNPFNFHHVSGVCVFFPHYNPYIYPSFSRQHCISRIAAEKSVYCAVSMRSPYLTLHDPSLDISCINPS